MSAIDLIAIVIGGLIAVFFLFLAWVWTMTAIVGLVRTLLHAPFSREARADLATRQFLRHPFFIFGPRAPTPKMKALARRVAQERGVTLPLTTLGSFYRTRRFLNQHSRDWLPPRRW